MKNLINIFLMIFILPLISGWTGPPDSFGDVTHKIPEKTSKQTQRRPSLFQSSYYLQKAKTYKNNDELQLALFYLKVAAELSPDDKTIAGKISDLKLSIETKSNRYFKKGKKFYNQKKIQEARTHFLTALRYNPDHKDALHYLKNKLIPKEYINYTYGEKDDLKIISNKFYKDPELVFLIVHFNNLKSDTEPDPGKILKIPLLEPKFIQTIGDHRQDMIAARNLFEKKQYQKVVVITKTIPENDPLHKEAIQLQNDAFYQIGIQLSGHGRYLEAIDTFKKIDPENEDINGVIYEAIHHGLLKAENLIKEKKYDQAIDLSKKILEYDRSNAAARKLISTSFCQQGNDLFKRKKYDQALKLLDNVDPADDCAKKIKLAVKKAIIQQAEAHYLQGVKHFLNEELQSAIKEWEKTLKLNPEHDMAKKNIKKAGSLLEKLNKVK